jgi:cellulose biosynthesis protein BcsS
MHAVRQSHAGLRIAAACAAMLVASGAAADEPQAYEIDAGFDAAPQSLYWYSEAITALNRDMAQDGLLVRVYGSLAVYQYAGTAIDGTVDGTLWQLDLMPGYQMVRGAATYGGFVGLDYQQSELSPPDPTNAVRGTATGLKVEGHYYFADDKQPIEASLVGEYSTAFDTYYAELRIGARVCDKLIVGPDASVDGDTGYDAQRLGGYAKYAFELTKGIPLQLTLIAGHQFVSSGGTGFGGGAGTFGTLEIDTDF